MKDSDVKFQSQILVLVDIYKWIITSINYFKIQKV